MWVAMVAHAAAMQEMVHVEWKYSTCCECCTQVDANQDTCSHCITASITFGKHDMVILVNCCMHMTLWTNKRLTKTQMYGGSNEWMTGSLSG